MPDATVVSDLEGGLTGQGLASSLTDTVLAAINSAGYDLTPSGGGSPAATVDFVATTRVGVTGMPGVYIVSATLGDGSAPRWMEVVAAGGCTRISLGMLQGSIAWSAIISKPTTLSGYGITDAQPLDAELSALAGLTSAANKLPYFTGSGAAALASFTPAGHALTLSADATIGGTSSGTNTGDQDLSGYVPTTRTVNGHALSTNVTVTAADLSLVIGTNVQAWDADLDALAGLSGAANKLPYFTGTHTMALASFTPAGHALTLSADATIGGTNTGDQDLSGYVVTTRTVNGHALSADVTVTKSDLSLGSVENTALSTWAGSANITTLGTVVTGTWHGTIVGLAYGGTGADLSATGTAGGVLMQLSAGAAAVVKVRPMIVPIWTSNNTSASATAVASGAAEIHATTSHGMQTTLDLSGFTQYRLVAKFGATGAAGVKVMARGSVGGSGVHNLEDTSDAANTAACTYSSNGEVVGAWTALHATYAVDGVLVTLYTVGGDGATSLAYRRFELQFR